MELISSLLSNITAGIYFVILFTTSSALSGVTIKAKLSIYQYVNLCIYLSIYPNIYIPIYLFIYLSIFLSVSLCVYTQPHIRLSICLSVYNAESLYQIVYRSVTSYFESFLRKYWGLSQILTHNMAGRKKRGVLPAVFFNWKISDKHTLNVEIFEKFLYSNEINLPLSAGLVTPLDCPYILTVKTERGFLSIIS